MLRRIKFDRHLHLSKKFLHNLLCVYRVSKTLKQVLQQGAYPAICRQPPVDAHDSAIRDGPLGRSPKMGENRSDMWPNRHAKFRADR